MNKEELNKLCGEITEKLDNTAEYENWLIIQDYIDQQDQIIREARELLNDNSERCKSALTNPEYTIVSKHELLKLEINDIKEVMEILDRNVK